MGGVEGAGVMPRPMKLAKRLAGRDFYLRALRHMAELVHG